MQDDDKIERLKEQVHRLTAAKMELEDELALLRGAVRDRNVQIRTLQEQGTQYSKAALELVGANH